MLPEGCLVLICIPAFLALVLAIRQGLKQYAMRQVGGRLSFDADALPTASYSVGDFVVTWDPARGGQLTISHHWQPDKVLWASLPGKSFLATAQGVETVKQARGNFFISDRLQAIYAEQTITSIVTGVRAVTVAGTLSSSRRRGNVDYSLTFSDEWTNRLSFDFTLGNNQHNRTFLTYASEQDERFFGFGEQFSCFDLKGKRLPLFVMEQGVGRGAQPITLGANLAAQAGGAWHTTYAGVPHYITSKLRSLFLKTYQYAVFDLRHADRVQIQLFSPQMSGCILFGTSPSQLIEAYTLYAGRMRPLPDWILEGAVVGMQGGTEKVRQILAQLQAIDTPITAFWLQDWVGQRATSFGQQLWWNWELDREQYPEWGALLAELDEQKIKIMTYINCFLVDASEKPNHQRNLSQEAKAGDYLVQNQAGEPYLVENTDFSAGMIDLTNPVAYEWMKGVIQEQVVGAGAWGWMADYGEGLPYDAVLFSGEAASTYHNRYPEAWAQLNREAIDELGIGDQFVFFTRSAYRESPAFSTLFWLGDQLVSWDHYDGIKTAVIGLLSSGLSGFGLNHSDIGGYTANTNLIRNYHRSKELLLRWMELNAFTTIYRTHEGNLPDVNHQFYSDQETMNHFCRFARVYQAWAFYRKQLMEEVSGSGLPVVRHPFIHFPSDPNVFDLSYQQFMIGEEFMIAPVLDPGTDQVRIYLPAGRWVHLWSGETYATVEKGRWVSVAAPIGQPGVFYKEGSEIAGQFITNLRRAGVLER